MRTDITQHIRVVADHEQEYDHLVVADLNSVYRTNGGANTQTWYCEGIGDQHVCNRRVRRDWDGTRWTSWYLV